MACDAAPTGPPGLNRNPTNRCIEAIGRASAVSAFRATLWCTGIKEVLLVVNIRKRDIALEKGSRTNSAEHPSGDLAIGS